MPKAGQAIEQSHGFRDKCYKTKDDKSHASSTISFKLTDDQANDIANWKSEKKEVVKEKTEVNCPNVSKWNPEFTYLSTGYRMSKSRLKEYCKRNGKTWEN